jgi:hypothetical protein
MMMDISSVVAAILFVISNILDFVYTKRFKDRSHFNYTAFIEMDPTFIEEEYQFLSENRSLELAAGTLNSMAWFALMIPVVQVAWIQSCSGTRQLGMHVTIMALALGGAFIEFISRLLLIGTSAAAEWISISFNLDNWTGENSNDKIGWRTLHLSHIVVRGMITWVDAAEWLSLFGITVLLFVSIYRQKERIFSMPWASVGLAMGLLALVDFAADILRLESWRTFSDIALWATMINRIILLPVWLLWLGYQLPKAKELATTLRSDDKGLELKDEAAAPKMEASTLT